MNTVNVLVRGGIGKHGVKFLNVVDQISEGSMVVIL